MNEAITAISERSPLWEFHPAAEVGEESGSRLRVPYPGLRPFRDDEWILFCGRSLNRMELLAKLEQTRFLAVIGASGSGKSSLVMAGLLPDIADGLLLSVDPENYRQVVFKPGSNPFRSLAGKLAAAFSAPEEAREIEEILRTDGSRRGFEKVLDRYEKSGVEKPSLVLVADQFEELFRFASLDRDEVTAPDFLASRDGRPVLDTAHDEAQAFVDLLLNAHLLTDRSVHVVLTMRSDFLHRCEAFDRLPSAISRFQYLVPRPRREQLADSIAIPPTHFGARVNPDLVNLILNELAPEQDQLPILQHTLARMWHHAKTAHPDSPVITVADYRAVGGLKDAMELHGDELLGSLTKVGINEDQVGRFFRCLAEWDPTGALIRRPRTVRQIADESGLSITTVVKVADVFRAEPNHWLTPMTEEVSKLSADQALDLTHESLLRKWSKFSGPEGWMEVERDRGDQFLRLMERVNEPIPITHYQQRVLDWLKVDQWTIASGDVAASQLHRFCKMFLTKPEPTEAWAGRYGGEWNAARKYLKAKIDRRLLNRIITLIVILAFVALAGAVGWQDYRSKAEKLTREKKENERLSDEIKFRRSLGQGIAGAVLPFVKSCRSAIADAERNMGILSGAIQDAATGSAPGQDVIDSFQRSREIAGKAVAAIDEMAGKLRVAANETHDEELAKVVTQIETKAAQLKHEYRALQANPDVGAILRDSFAKRLAKMESVLAGLLGKRVISPTEAAANDANVLEATADMEALAGIRAAATALGFTDLDRVATREVAIRRTLGLAREAKQNAPATAKIVVWGADRAVGTLIHEKRINRVRFSPTVLDGKLLLVSGGDDKEIRFWRPDGSSLGQIGTSSPVNDVAFNPTGTAIAAASNGSTVRIFRWTDLLNIAEAKRRVLAFGGHSDSITDVEFSPHDGKSIVSGSADRTVRVFDADSLKQRYYTSPPLPGIVTSVEFDPTGNLVVSGCDDGGVRLHTISPPGIRLLGKFGAPAKSPEFSHDGDWVVAASGDKTARVWPLDGKAIFTLEQAAPVTRATFRPVAGSAGHDFVTTATNGEVRFVHFQDEKPRAAVLTPRHPGAAVSATWSTDGAWLATAGGGEILLWKWTDTLPVAVLRIEPATAPTRCEFSPDAGFLVTYGNDEKAFVWDLSGLSQK